MQATKEKKATGKLSVMLLNQDISLDKRLEHIRQLILHDDENGVNALAEILDVASNAGTDETLQERTRKLNAAIEEINWAGVASW